MKTGDRDPHHPGMWLAEELPVSPGEVGVRFDAEGERYLVRCICEATDLPQCCHGYAREPKTRWCYACRGWSGKGRGSWSRMRWNTIREPPDLKTGPRPLDPKRETEG